MNDTVRIDLGEKNIQRPQVLTVKLTMSAGTGHETQKTKKSIGSKQTTKVMELNRGAIN